MLKILVTNLIIVFNCLLLLGCFTFDSSTKGKWPEPSKPMKKDVESQPVYQGQNFVVPHDGIYINRESANNLLFNISELDGYIEKQKALINEMKSYYNAK